MRKGLMVPAHFALFSTINLISSFVKGDALNYSGT
jgi:hypothetical protein